MRKWHAVGQAFESIGASLSVECENMEAVCEADPAFEELYLYYAMMLETLMAQRRYIAAMYDEIG